MLPRLSSTSRSSHLSLLSAGIIAQATKPATPTVFPNWLFMWVFVDSWQKNSLGELFKSQRRKLSSSQKIGRRKQGGLQSSVCKWLPAWELPVSPRHVPSSGCTELHCEAGISGARPLAGLWSLRRMRVMVSVNCQLDNIWTHPGDSSHASERVTAVQLAEVRRHGLKTGGAIPRVWALPRRACAHSVRSAPWL